MRDVQERFWSKVDKTGDCWLWTDYLLRYGHFRVDGKMKIAHRFSWELVNGAIPVGMCVLHKCDIPACVNPSHLFLGSHTENMADMRSKGRAPRHIGKRNPNAKLTESQVMEIRALRQQGVSLRTLATRYGIGRTQVLRIDRGHSWAKEAFTC